MASRQAPKGQLASASAQSQLKDIPAPFSSAPEKYKAFLEALDPTKVYIVHLDTLPRDFKRKIFTAPVVLNVIISLLLVWRWYKIFPHYMELLMLVLGQESSAKVDPATQPASRTAWTIARRTLTFLIDFLLIRFAAGWPLTFFLQAPANPFLWRWRVGFADTEVIVRVSRDWGRADLMGGLARGDDSPFFKTRILPAIDKNFMHGKTGYLMIRKDWDLDYNGMIVATALIKEGKLSFKDFQKTVLAHSETHGWMTWAVHELDEGSEEVARKRIVAFKDRLTAMGKESLFFRWVELIQYESSRPGGFTRERQQEAVEKAKTLFEQQGVDFEEFVKSLGGVETFPGMVGER